MIEDLACPRLNSSESNMNATPRRQIVKTPSAQPSTPVPPPSTTLAGRAGQNLAAALVSRTMKKKAAEPKPYELAPRAPTPSPPRDNDWFRLMSARNAANKAALMARPRQYVKKNVGERDVPPTVMMKGFGSQAEGHIGSGDEEEEENDEDEILPPTPCPGWRKSVAVTTTTSPLVGLMSSPARRPPRVPITPSLLRQPPRRFALPGSGFAKDAKGEGQDRE